MFNNTQRGANMTHTILRLPTIKTSTGLSRSTIYLRIAQGVFTKPVSLGGRAVGWPASEVAALNAARIAGKPDEAVRELVTQLEAARKAIW
jgi:prophage regulatory protein